MTKENIANVRKIVSEGLSGNLPKWKVESMNYLQTKTIDNSDVIHEAYWPSRRAQNFWNKVFPAIDVANTCIKKKDWDLENTSPKVVLGSGQEIIGQKVVEFGRSGLNTWYGIPYADFTGRFELASKIKNHGRRSTKNSIGSRISLSSNVCL